MSNLGRAFDRGAGALLAAVDAVAAGLLFLDLLVVSASVLSRYVLNSRKRCSATLALAG